jgi:hypothetical protein
LPFFIDTSSSSPVKKKEFHPSAASAVPVNKCVLLHFQCMRPIRAWNLWYLSYNIFIKEDNHLISLSMRLAKDILPRMYTICNSGK